MIFCQSSGMLPIGVARILDPVSTQQHHRILCRCYPVVPRALGGGLKYFVEFQPYLGKNKTHFDFHIFCRWVGEKLQPGPSTTSENKKRFPGFLGFLDVSKERWRQQQTSLEAPRRLAIMASFALLNEASWALEDGTMGPH